MLWMLSIDHQEEKEMTDRVSVNALKGFRADCGLVLEETRMRYHSQVLTNAEDWNRPRLGTMSKAAKRRKRRLVKANIVAVGVHQNVCIDSNQRRPSMMSYSESRSAMSTPGRSRP